MTKKIQKYETIILGGGPSGLSAGLTLLKAKKNCCILEKESYPRLKLCGGLLTPKTVQLLEELGFFYQKELSYCAVSSFAIDHQKKEILTLNAKEDFISLNRTELDNALANLYKKQGGLLYEKEKVVSIDLEKHLVYTTQKIYQYENLIGADGMTGITLKYFKKKKVQKAFCLEVLQKNKEKVSPIIKLDTGVLPKGYAWIFPKKEGLCLGLGGQNYKKIDYLSLYKDYFKEDLEMDEKTKIRGAFIPFGKCDKRLSQEEGHLFLTGDAAGFIDVITGEGIYSALASGRMVAQSLLENENDFVKSAKAYQKKAKELIKITNNSNRMAFLFYHLRRFFYWLCKKVPSLLQFFLENQIMYDKYHYDVFLFIKGYLKERGHKNEKFDE